MTAETILTSITQAFSDISYPGDQRLASIPPPYCVPSEDAYVVSYFKGKRWTEVSFTDLRKNYAGPPDACLSFMSPHAFRYYLPAFMVIAITDHDIADMVAHSALNALLPPEDEGQKSWWQKRVSGFTPTQREAITLFLEYLDVRSSEDYPVYGPKQALKYWKAPS